MDTVTSSDTGQLAICRPDASICCCAALPPLSDAPNPCFLARFDFYCASAYFF